MEMERNLFQANRKALILVRQHSPMVVGESSKRFLMPPTQNK